MSLTSSMLERAHECLASTVLPQTPHSGIEAEHGNENHAKAERGEVHAKIAEYIAGLGAYETEVSFVLDVLTRTVRRVDGHRNYGELAWHEIGTTPDIFAPFNTLDHKSRKRVTSASRNWQIKTHAVAAAFFSSGKPIVAGLAYLDDGTLDLATFGPIEIAAAWADLRELAESVRKIKDVMREFPTSQLTPRRGSWCEYCPALLSCPAQRAALTVFRNTADISTMVASASDEEIEAARLTKLALERMLKQFDEAVRARAAQAPIKLGNGKELRMIECRRSSDDVYLMKERLRSHGDDPEQFKRTITYHQLKECKQ